MPRGTDCFRNSSGTPVRFALLRWRKALDSNQMPGSTDAVAERARNPSGITFRKIAPTVERCELNALGSSSSSSSFSSSERDRIPGRHFEDEDENEDEAALTGPGCFQVRTTPLWD